ncbi:MAG: DUF4397 domain-containing protein [Acidimicrobiales bacterium]|jgi:hypothetical protein
MKFLRIALAAFCGATLVSVLAATSAGAATTHATVRTAPTVAEATLIQGLPQTSVDVYLNGTEIVQNFRFKGVVGPLPLVPGRYHLAIRLHGTKRDTKPLLEGTGWLKAGDDVTIVAELDSAGNPALARFWNPRPEIAKGRSELVVRNVADDAGLTVYADGLRIFRNLTNPNSAAIRLPSEWVKVTMDDYGTTTTVIGPLAVHLVSQTVTIIYVLGNPATHTLTTLRESYSAS